MTSTAGLAGMVAVKTRVLSCSSSTSHEFRSDCTNCLRFLDVAVKTWGRDMVLTQLQDLDWRFSTTFSGMACLEHAAISATSLHLSRTPGVSGLSFS